MLANVIDGCKLQLEVFLLLRIVKDKSDVVRSFRKEILVGVKKTFDISKVLADLVKN